LAVAVTAVGLFASGCLGDVVGAPVPMTAAIHVEYPAPAAEASTWGMPLPTSDRPATLRAVELVGVANLEVLGIAACSGWTAHSDGSRNHCAPGTARGWPPDGVETLSVAGLALPIDPEGDAAGIVIGLRRTGSGDGRVEAVRLVYESGGLTYAIVQPWSVTLTEPDS
jgi:hypothetical protein